MPHPPTLLAVLGDAIRSTIEMKMKDWKPRSEGGKRLLADAKAEAEREVLAEVADEARAKILAEGRAASIVDLLDVRGIPLDPPLRERITACTDLDQRVRWLRRAATATAAEEAFAA